MVLHILTDPNGIVKQSKVVIYLKEQLRVVVNDVGLSEECILAGGLSFTSFALSHMISHSIDRLPRTSRSINVPKRAMVVPNILSNIFMQRERFVSRMERRLCKSETERSRDLDEEIGRECNCWRGFVESFVFMNHESLF